MLVVKFGKTREGSQPWTCNSPTQKKREGGSRDEERVLTNHFVEQHIHAVRKFCIINWGEERNSTLEGGGCLGFGSTVREREDPRLSKGETSQAGTEGLEALTEGDSFFSRHFIGSRDYPRGQFGK